MKYRITIACTKDKLKEIRIFVRKSLQNHGLDDVQISAMVLAIDEISANLIIHGHDCNPKDKFELNIEVIKGKGVIFKIYDDGDIFDINSYEAPNIDDLIKRQRKGGVGLILVKKIMDEIKLDSVSGKTCYRLYKNVEID